MSWASFFIELLERLLELAGQTAFIWAPIGLGTLAWQAWLRYVNADFLSRIKWVMIEVRLPREIRRSPLAMELALNALHQTGGTGTWYAKYWQGKVRNYFSLEIVSLEGRVRFFIRTPEDFRNAIESYIYAQYPEAEIDVVPDYTETLQYARGGRWAMFGSEFALTQPDAYPIKTYIDYGLDKNAKEEEKIDPITPMLELMGSLGKGEQMWFQILVRAVDNKEWKEEAVEEIKKIKEKKKGDMAEGEKWNENMLTRGEKDTISAIERTSDKLAFHTGIRAIYIAEQDTFKPANIGGMMNALKQYNSNSLNGFKPARATSVDYPWQDWGKKTTDKMKMRIFQAYRDRGYFYPPWKRDPFILSSEELATIYHFPGGVAETPSFGRIESKKAEPPVNLPL